MKAQGLTKETIKNIGEKKLNFPDFQVGDTIAVSQVIKEGGKQRLQVFQGDVIAISKNGVSSTFIVRKIGAHGIPVERIFPFYSPHINSIKLIKHGDVRRAKLYYVRDRIGKAARLKEKILTKAQKEQKAAAAAKESAEVTQGTSQDATE